MTIATSTVAYLKEQITYWGKMAVQADQLQDLNGNFATMPSVVVAGNAMQGRTTVTPAAATIAVTTAMASGIIDLGTLTGSVATLPLATGTQNEYTFIVSVVATSNYHEILTGRAADCFQGQIFGETAGTVTAWPSLFATTNIAIKLDGLHKGGSAIGDMVTVRDVGTNTWQILRSYITQTASSPATPFSTTA